MTPEDFTAELANRLRRKGIEFNPADLNAFAADVCRTQAPYGDIEVFAERFREAQEAALKRKRARACLEAVCFFGIGGVLLGLAALAVMNYAFMECGKGIIGMVLVSAGFAVAGWRFAGRR
jgi:hypothetical protein